MPCDPKGISLSGLMNVDALFREMVLSLQTNTVPSPLSAPSSSPASDTIAYGARIVFVR